MMPLASTNDYVSLSTLKPGAEGTILSFDKGRAFRQRLLNLGVVPGESVTVVRGGGRHPMVLDVRGNKVVLGAGMTSRVFVVPHHS